MKLSEADHAAVIAEALAILAEKDGIVRDRTGKPKQKIQPCEERRKKARAYYLANREKLITQQVVYYEANREKIKAYYRANRRKIAARYVKSVQPKNDRPDF